MTSTSRVPFVIDYLLSTFRAAATLGGANPPVQVIDGPETVGDELKLQLYVGLQDPDNIDIQEGADSEQSWAGLGAMARDEEMKVYCVAHAWEGDATVAQMRTAAYAIVAAVEVIIRADASIGGNVLFGGVVPTAYLPGSVDKGVFVRVPFYIEAKARI